MTDAGSMTQAAAVDQYQIVQSAWRDEELWSETADRLKAELTRWRNWAAIAGVAGALFETFAGTLGGLDAPWSWLRPAIALAGAAILAIVPIVLRTKASNDRVAEWTRARSASEALKEEIYRYLVGAPPYGPDPALTTLIERCQAVKDKVADLAGRTAEVEPATPKRPLALTPEGYVDQRINDQIDNYYRPKGRENAIKARKLHELEFWLGVLAAGLGALAGVTAVPELSLLPHLSPWVAVLTTAGAAVTAHLAAARYDHAAMTYTATAIRLAALRDAWQADPNRLEPARVGKLVDDCENAISTENEAWLAEWTRVDADP
jgi:SMODS and SLOG-associating 2TM effector domain 1/Protein of unknown function (DUF4231)